MRVVVVGSRGRQHDAAVHADVVARALTRGQHRRGGARQRLATPADRRRGRVRRHDPISGVTTDTCRRRGTRHSRNDPSSSSSPLFPLLFLHSFWAILVLKPCSQRVNRTELQFTKWSSVQLHSCTVNKPQLKDPSSSSSFCVPSPFPSPPPAPQYPPSAPPPLPPPPPTRPPEDAYFWSSRSRVRRRPRHWHSTAVKTTKLSTSSALPIAAVFNSVDQCPPRRRLDTDPEQGPDFQNFLRRSWENLGKTTELTKIVGKS